MYARLPKDKKPRPKRGSGVLTGALCDGAPRLNQPPLLVRRFGPDPRIVWTNEVDRWYLANAIKHSPIRATVTSSRRSDRKPFRPRSGSVMLSRYSFPEISADTINKDPSRESGPHCLSRFGFLNVSSCVRFSYT